MKKEKSKLILTERHIRANQFLGINWELAKKALGKKGYYSYRTTEGKELIRLARIDLPYSKKTGNLDIWMTLSRYYVTLKSGGR